MTWSKKLLIGYKLVFSLLGFAALVTEIATLVERGLFNPINFFSYFTVQTNIVVSVVLLLGALAVAMGKQSKLDILRSAATVYILVVGIGFSLLLSTMEGLVLTAVPWDNTVLHYIIPAAVLVDFLIDRPKRRISLKAGLVWLLFPALYMVYSFIRGAIDGWYPYPFLDPDINGIGAVVATVGGLSVLTFLLIVTVTKLSGKKRS